MHSHADMSVRFGSVVVLLIKGLLFLNVHHTSILNFWGLDIPGILSAHVTRETIFET